MLSTVRMRMYSIIPFAPFQRQSSWWSPGFPPIWVFHQGSYLQQKRDEKAESPPTLLDLKVTLLLCQLSLYVDTATHSTNLDHKEK